jgi:glyoxylase-like metal-dependent hydrolase (beta-lactamase superfamily II)
MERVMLKHVITSFAFAVAGLLFNPIVQADDWPAQPPGYYRLQLGNFRVTVLSDGTASRDLATIMSDPDNVQKALADSHEVPPIPISINCFLIEIADRTVLIDTGAGELFGPASGKLVANLKASGHQPEDIGAILLTHIHGDHSGGLSIAGVPVFPNAVVYVDRRDADYWLSSTADARIPTARKMTFKQSHQTVDPYVKAGRLKTFDGATALFPGIQSVPEYGHTPGHSGYMIESAGRQLLVWGDIVHAAEVQFSDPAITIDYDVDPGTAIGSRLRTLKNAAEEGFLVGGAHLSFPGLGHVREELTGFSWVPLPYSATAQ